MKIKMKNDENKKKVNKNTIQNTAQVSDITQVFQYTLCRVCMDMMQVSID